MHVNKVRNIYKCFVCGKGGDVIKLVMDNDNKSIIEACDWLVEQFHIVLIDDAPVKTNTDCTDKTDKNESVSSEQSVVEKKEISAISAISCVPSVASEQSSSAAGPQKSVSSEQSVVEKKEISAISAKLKRDLKQPLFPWMQTSFRGPCPWIRCSVTAKQL